MIEPGRFVITGIGIASPAGRDPDTCFETLSRGQPLFRERKVFGERAPGVPVASVDDAGPDHGIPRRLAKKIDRFTLLALMAARGALADAKIEVRADIDERIGMVIGNATGGWSFVEPMMYGLFTEGMGAISSYVATAWFPAAPQGEISILLRLAGYSKTVSADRISAGFALEQALRSVGAGRAPFMLAGGAEAPLNALVLGAHLQGGGLAAEGAGRLGEGAALLVVECKESAAARSRAPYAQVLAAESGPTLGDAVRRCLFRSGVPGGEIDHVLLDAPGDPAAGAEELAMIQEVFLNRPDLRVSAPKTMYGDLLGAGMAADVASACLGLSRQVVLPSAAGTRLPGGPYPFRHVEGAAEPCRLRHVLVNGRDHEGRGFAVLLGESDPHS